jgi:tetratricopeptide (TPR) repeat protein
MSAYLQELKGLLRRLHREAGEISTREIARRSHGAVSHTTAHQVLRSDSIPSWKSLEIVVQALQGDVERFKSLWIRARDASEASDAQGVTTPTVGYSERVDTTTAATINLARWHYLRKEEKESREVLESFLGSSYLEATVLATLGEYYWDKPEVRATYTDAIKALAVTQYPEDVETARGAMWLARYCLGEMRDTKQALRWAEHALHLNPHSARSLNTFGVMLLANSRYIEATEALLHAHALNPKEMRWFHTIRRALTITRQFDKLEEVAKRIYEENLAVASTDLEDALHYYVETLVLCGKTSDAVRMHMKVLELYEEEAPTYVVTDLSRTLEAAGNIQEAKNLLKNDPRYENDTELQSAFANLLMRAQDSDSGAQHLMALRAAAAASRKSS